MPWRYSGSKKRLLKYLPAPPLGTATIVEPFAGSAAYGMHYKPIELVESKKNEPVSPGSSYHRQGPWQGWCSSGEREESPKTLAQDRVSFASYNVSDSINLHQI